jgi:hypothetical protein
MDSTIWRNSGQEILSKYFKPVETGSLKHLAASLFKKVELTAVTINKSKFDSVDLLRFSTLTCVTQVLIFANSYSDSFNVTY